MVNIDEPIYNSILNENSFKTRQNLIKIIQQQLGGKLICYVESMDNPFSSITQIDSIHFEDLLRSTGDSKKGFLLLNSNGGDPNAAEKLLNMCRKKFTEEFITIVPNYAKSAATMMCLGADKIMMGYMAELGPIDPQIPVPPNFIPIPARSFIDGLNMVRKNVKEGDPPPMYLSMLQNISPELIAICDAAIEHSNNFAKEWLTKGMLKDNPAQAEKVAELLSKGIAYKSHGKVINYDEAKNTLQLNVEKIDEFSELWYYIWELYIRSITFLKSRGPGAAKLYESEKVSLALNVAPPVGLGSAKNG